jgi:hypothetical protein
MVFLMFRPRGYPRCVQAANDTDTVWRIVANERIMAGLAEYSLRMTSVETIMALF